MLTDWDSAPIIFSYKTNLRNIFDSHKIEAMAQLYSSLGSDH